MSIRLRSRRGSIGKAWHAVDLRTAIEVILGVGRSGSGKADARAGTVQWLDVGTGTACGDVLDADGSLYRARIDLPAFSPADRAEFVRIARRRPSLPTQLAAGSYPQAVDEELDRADVSLLPRGASELSHDCSCLNWPGPCRHVAALSYVLVEAVDERPLQLLTLRGLSLEDLVDQGTGHDRGDEVAARAEADEHDDTGAGPSATAAFDPERADPALLAEAIGDRAAAVLASFYRNRP